MFELRSIGSGYPTKNQMHWLHRHISLQVRPGTLLLMAGKNGAGKSTLMRLMAGLDTPAEGQILVNDQDLHRMPAQQRAGAVALMLAQPPDLPLTSCAEVVLTSRQRFFSPWQWDTDSHMPEVLKALDYCGIRGFAQREFNRLSDGEKQKVMLARCLAQDTPVLLLDEPLAFMDYPSRREMLQLLDRLCRDLGKTIIYSSHDLELSLKHCHQLLLLGENEAWKLITDRQQLADLSPELLFEP